MPNASFRFRSENYDNELNDAKCNEGKTVPGTEHDTTVGVEYLAGF